MSSNSGEFFIEVKINNLRHLVETRVFAGGIKIYTDDVILFLTDLIEDARIIDVPENLSFSVNCAEISETQTQTKYLDFLKD